jgi:hypothetical protein
MIQMYGNGVITVKHVKKCADFENCRTSIHDDEHAGQLSISRTNVNTAHKEELILEIQEVTRDCQFHSNEVEMAVHEWLQMYRCAWGLC